MAAPAALAIALCLYELTTRSLWLDEAASVAIAGQHGSALWSAISHDGGNMLGYYALLHVLIGWFGHGEFVIRLPSALAAGGATAAVSLLALRLFDRRVAVAAGMLTAVSLPLVFWGQEARGYAPMVALVAGSFAAFAALVQTRSRRAWITYVALTVLAVYASFVAVLALPAQLAALAWRREAWRRFASAIAACVVCWVPLAVLAASRGSGQLFWIPRPSLKLEKQLILALTSAGFEPNFRPTWAA
ncbi:MAG TPA: glycosyltransferase family 39 protein, partial [Solirubrobacteraceae bacterium]|nr:glycosyltransferase family 39 protein [Solirubrobacteraceae bacterium]